MAKEEAYIRAIKKVSETTKVNIPRLYSYMRFSKPDQINGTSLERQMLYAKSYAKNYGLLFDEDERASF